MGIPFALPCARERWSTVVRVMTPVIRLVLADDHAVVRRGLAQLCPRPPTSRSWALPPTAATPSAWCGPSSPT